MLECDLPEHAILAGRRRQLAVVCVDGVGAQQIDDEFVDGGQFFHEVPRIFAGEQPLVDHGVEFLVRFRPEDLETRFAPGKVIGRRHRLSLNRDPVLALAPGGPCGEHALLQLWPVVQLSEIGSRMDLGDA